MSVPRNLGRQFTPNPMHDALRPLKETLTKKGISFSRVSGHLSTNSNVLFGRKMTKAERLSFAIKKHADDPDNFPENIGLK